MTAIFCPVCHNRGTKIGCGICGKLALSDELRFERYRQEDRAFKALPKEERRRIVLERAEANRQKEIEIEERRRAKELEEYHLNQWEKLRDFQMPGTGNDNLDRILREKYGDWEFAKSPTHNH